MRHFFFLRLLLAGHCFLFLALLGAFSGDTGFPLPWRNSKFLPALPADPCSRSLAGHCLHGTPSHTGARVRTCLLGTFLFFPLFPGMLNRYSSSSLLPIGYCSGCSLSLSLCECTLCLHVFLCTSTSSTAGEVRAPTFPLHCYPFLCGVYAFQLTTPCTNLLLSYFAPSTV